MTARNSNTTANVLATFRLTGEGRLSSLQEPHAAREEVERRDGGVDQLGHIENSFVHPERANTVPEEGPEPRGSDVPATNGAPLGIWRWLPGAAGSGSAGRTEGRNR